MRRSTLIRFLAIVLVISMLAAPISAAGVGTAANESNEWGGLIGIIIEIIRNIFDSWFRQDEPAEPADPVTSTEHGGTSTSTEAGAAAPAETVPGEPVAENPVYEQTQTGGSQNADVDLSATGNTPVTMGNVNMGLNPMGTVSNVSETAPESAKIEGITGTGSSVDTSEPAFDKAVANAFDGDTDTFWATVPNDTLANAYLIANLGAKYTINKVQYTKRISGTSYNCTGNLNNYVIEVSTDGTTWTKVAEGTTVDGTTVITFTAVEATHVRLTSTSSYHWQSQNVNTVMTCAEFEVFGYVESTEPEEPDVPEGDSVAHTGLTWQQVKDGTYYADKACTNKVAVNEVVEGSSEYQQVNVTIGDLWNSFGGNEVDVKYATNYFHYNTNANWGSTGYHPVYVSKNSFDWIYLYWPMENGNYIQIGVYSLTDTFSLYEQAGTITGYTLTDANGQTLATLNGTDLTTPVDVTLYTPKVEEPESPTVVYFPVTMYNYHTDALNNATKALDGDTVFRGLYFFNGSPDYTKTTTSDLSNFVAGQYYIQNIRAAENNVNSWISYYVSNENMAMIRAESKDDATLWTLEVEGGNYYLSTTVDGTKLYLTLNGSGADADSFTEVKTAITISGYAHNAEGVQLSKDGNYLCQWDSQTTTYFGGYGVSNDSGNGMKFYPVGSNTPVAPGATETKITSGYEEWNRWDKASGDNSKGDLFYTGLVQDEMVNDQIVFNIPQAGIFTDVDDETKDVYQFVGMPFELRKYTEEDNAGKLGVYYTFDSDRNGVYFKGAPQSGTGAGVDEMHKLHFAPLAPQPMPHTVDVGDHSTNAFLPYNNSWTNETKADGTVVGRYSGRIDYHFGMRADLPFAMTPNGRIKATDDKSEPITFTFSGDDDVWVFIDGHLVIDLGGIHNRLDATINFAENTITYSEENGQDEDHSTGSYNDSTFATTQQLFTADGVEGVIPMSRDAFALDLDHEMQVFYLERGEGTSNGRIEFNLPMNDTVIVTKDATQSWSKAAEDRDAALNKDDDTTNDVDPNELGLENLTPREQASVNNIDFGFTLYKKTANSETFTPVANTNFYLIGRGVEGTVIRMTDSNGHFYLKNEQSAKFLTDLPTEGVTYYVVEDKVPDGFVAPDFNYAGKASYDFTWVDAAETGETGTAPAADASQIPEQIIPMPDKVGDNWENWHVNKSYEITVKGSVENQDSIEFICSNFLNADLPKPTALAYEDIIVIDYGLPVRIDPLVNDVFRGDNIEIVAWGDESLVLNEQLDEYGNAVPHGTTGGTSWTGTQEFHFGNVEFKDKTYPETAETVTIDDRDSFVYTLNKQLTEVEVIHYIIKVTSSNDVIVDGEVAEQVTACRYSLAKIYIVPATVMYYEENFSDLVTFTNNEKEGYKNKWGETVNTAGASDYQEPGVVGTIGDSVYGSDVAYVNDSFDSNGTSRHADTTNGALAFSYTFTGTGTTIFGRTSADTGYIQVKIYDLNGDEEKLLGIYYRDTYWKDENLTNLDSDGTLYNIPLYTNEDLDYGTYKVVCTIAKAGTPTANYKVDENGDPVLGEDGKFIPLGSGKDFYLDGIRIMQPLNEYSDEELVEKALGAYATDGESNIDTITLRYKLISDDITGDSLWNFAVLTDIDGNVVNAEDYISIGPKEEVYLLPGQSVSFSVKYWHKDGYQMHMGMKAPFGDASVKVGQTTFDLTNAADCYFDITDVQVSSVTKYEQATDENGYLLYTDKDGNQVYKDGNGEFFYVTTGESVSENAVLTPVDDLNQPYFVATYTFTATDKIVSLTNIKAVGNYSFILYENIDQYVDGSQGSNENFESGEGNE